MMVIKRTQLKKYVLISIILTSSAYSTVGTNTTISSNSFTILPVNSTADISTVTVHALRVVNVSDDESLAEPSIEKPDLVKAAQRSIAHGTGKLVVLHSPKSIKFKNSLSTTEINLPNIYLASLGFSIDEKAKWNGMNILDPFNLPRAVVQVGIDGYNLIEHAENYTDQFRRRLESSVLYKDDKDTNITIYSLKLAMHEPDIFEKVKKRIGLTANMLNNMVTMRLSDRRKMSHFFGSPVEMRKLNLNVLKYLKGTVKEDKDFLAELSNMGVISGKVYSGAIVPNRTMVDFYDFKFTSLHPLVDHHGPNSPAVKEARGLLVEAAKMLRASFMKAYSEAVLVTLVTSDIPHSLRTSRLATSALRDGDNTPPTYSPEFPVIFNIILWTFVLLGLSLVGVCQAFMKMAADLKPVYLIAPKKKDAFAARDSV